MLKYTDYDVVFQEIPDEVTLAVNLSCCPNRCVGCHSPQLQSNIGEPLDESVLEGLMTRYEGLITCICFMGGDGDTNELERLARWIASRNSVCVGWYSGHDLLPQDFDVSSLNYIKLGSYHSEFGSLRHRTTNQRLYKVTAGGKLEDITARFWSDATPQDVSR